jgi:hypothetical protein
MSTSGPHRVSVLALRTVLPLELGIATQIFGTDPFYQLTVCAERRTNTVAGSDFTITAVANLEAMEGADTLIVPGYNIETELSTTLLRALADSHARARAWSPSAQAPSH